jgi:hypothetical protein
LISFCENKFKNRSYFQFVLHFLYETNQYVCLSENDIRYISDVIFDFIVKKVIENKQKNKIFDNTIIQELKELCYQNESFRTSIFENITVYSIPFVLFFSFYFYIHKIPYQFQNIEQNMANYETICNHMACILHYEGGKKSFGFGLVFEIVIRTIEGYSGVYHSGGGATSKYTLREDLVRRVFQITKRTYKKTNGYKKIIQQPIQPIHVLSISPPDISSFIFIPAYVSFACLYSHYLSYQSNSDETKV